MVTMLLQRETGATQRCKVEHADKKAGAVITPSKPAAEPEASSTTLADKLKDT